MNEYAIEAFIATNRARLEEIFEKSPQNGDGSRKRNWWPSRDARCPATNIAAVVLGIDPGDFAEVFLSHGRDTAQRVRDLIEEIFFSSAFEGFMAGREFWISQGPAFRNATDRLARLAYREGLIDWPPNWDD